MTLIETVRRLFSSSGTSAVERESVLVGKIDELRRTAEAAELEAQAIESDAGFDAAEALLRGETPAPAVTRKLDSARMVRTGAAAAIAAIETELARTRAEAREERIRAIHLKLTALYGKWRRKQHVICLTYALHQFLEDPRANHAGDLATEASQLQIELRAAGASADTVSYAVNFAHGPVGHVYAAPHHVAAIDRMLAMLEPLADKMPTEEYPHALADFLRQDGATAPTAPLALQGGRFHVPEDGRIPL